MCFSSPSIPAPQPAPTVEEKQASVAPAVDSSSDTKGNGDATVNANRVGKSKLRIDLNPLVAGKSSGSSGGNGLAISG